MNERMVTSIGPGMVDMAFDMTTRPRDYREALNLLGLKPGGWKCIDDKQQFDELMKVLVGRNLPEALSEIVGLQQEKTFALIPGSSNLGVLAALNEHVRKRSDYISAVGSPDGVTADSLSQYFTHSLNRLGITHKYEIHKGKTAAGIVIGTQEEPDKVLAVHPGVMSELEKFPEKDYRVELLQVDAYELRKGPISQLIDRLISGHRYNVSLGLGNTAIINGTMRDQILRYISQGELTFLTGNESEFITLFDLKKQHLSDEDYETLARSVSVPNVLITLGARGIVAIREGTVYFQPSYPVRIEEITNTSGAGDTAAGVFISGILEHKDIHTVLSEATFYAAQLLKIKGSHLPNGRSI